MSVTYSEVQTIETEEEMQENPGPSRFRRIFWHHPLAWMGIIGLVLLVGFSFVGPLIYRANPYTLHLTAILKPPSAQFPLGTNNLGRNMLARLMLGGQMSLEVGFAAAISAMGIGIIYGMVAGYVGGWLDALMMRLVDLLRAIPGLFLLIFLDSLVTPSAGLLVVLIALTSWHGVSRLVRAEVLSLKHRLYVEASRAMGGSLGHIALRHLFPNILGTVIVATTFMVADSVLVIASLSFLGMGLPPPTPNWGAMLADAMTYLPQHTWWLIYPPGLAVLWTVLSISFIGDAFRAALDTRMDQKVRGGASE
ncbi:ABC transporter permease [Sulfobacillus thermosulfidooxidans]|uniref:ABC transporter permease n=1 Tax=Sulfobacillus thermosulfidooxidans TaxID=28034 RepID=UPI000A81AD06|nr:ABC transporter permease [Sulfobacillus thermosulfidooxidans]